MYSDSQIQALKAVQSTGKKYGMKMLADRLNVHTQTLYADVDPNSIGRRTNKLGFLDWLVIMDETKDLSSLYEVARIYKHICLPIPEPTEEIEPESWMEYCATIAKESGEAVSELAGSIMDKKFEPDEMARCEKETWEALQAFSGLYLAIKAARAKK